MRSRGNVVLAWSGDEPISNGSASEWRLRVKLRATDGPDACLDRPMTLVLDKEQAFALAVSLLRRNQGMFMLEPEQQAVLKSLIKDQDQG